MFLETIRQQKEVTNAIAQELRDKRVESIMSLKKNTDGAFSEMKVGCVLVCCCRRVESCCADTLHLSRALR